MGRLRAVVLGNEGMLGSDLVEVAPESILVLPDSSARPDERLDITDRAALGRMLDALRPDVVVNAAAYTRVDQAEAEEGVATAVNGTAVGSIGAECARRGVAVVHFSTDYVFSGTATSPYRETDATAPLNAYGRSKLAGEAALENSGVAALILRTQWLFGLRGRSFPRTMWNRARTRMATRVVADQSGRPTFTVDLARAAWSLVLGEHRGLFHVANSGSATWFTVADRIFARLGARECLSPCTSEEFPTPARRPSYGVLDTSKLTRTLGTALPHWTDALDRFLERLEHEESAVARSSAN